jgi:hypothetical protein
MKLSRRSAFLHFAPIAAGFLAPNAVFAQASESGQNGTGLNASTVTDAAASDRAIAERMLRGPGVGTVQRSRCGQRGSGGEIVVCAPDNEQFRARSSSDIDPTGAGGTNDGRLRPPDLAPKHNGVSVARGCFIPPCPPDAAYMIDLASIPEAPADSDADRIAKGEMRDR